MIDDGIRRKRWLRRGVQAALVLVVAGAGAYYFLRSSAEGGSVEYRFATLERGTITNAVSSTGKLASVGEVKITSQVAGQVIEVLVDYNTQVTQGQTLARLDPESFQSKVQQVEADLAIARASLVSNKAAVERSQSDIRNGEASLAALQAQLANSRVSFEAAERDLNLQRELFARNVVATKAVDDATTKYEQAKANFEQIQANIAAAAATQEGRKASLAQSLASVTTAEAQVKQREAQLTSAKIDLERTVIKAPISGTVIDRTAEIGTTIQNNSNTPLFTLAQDLRQMQVEVSVDEADIGKVQQGMTVKFAVDAFPGREFQATVRQVRLAPKTVQNVVTYTVLATAPNPDLTLLPGMTASARIIIEERTATLRIPNAALRYAPAGTPPLSSGAGAGALVFTTAGGGGGQVAAQAGGGGQGGAGFAKGGQAAAGGQGGQGAAGNAKGGQAVQAAGGAQGQGGQGGQGQGRGQGGGQNQAVQLAGLGLTEAQQSQVQQAIARAREQAAAAGGTPQEIQQRLAEAQRQAIVGVLTPEQRARFEAATAAGNVQIAQAQAPAAIGAGAVGDRGRGQNRARAARVFIMGPDGKPQAVPVMIGITDGGFTELVQGEIAQGTKVIIGSNEPAATPQVPGGAGALFGGGGGGVGGGFQVFIK